MEWLSIFNAENNENLQQFIHSAKCVLIANLLIAFHVIYIRHFNFSCILYNE